MQIALLTDFGGRDPYVGSVKGVLASRCAAAVADLTHEIAPFDVFEAAWHLRTVWRWWPAGTIFVCIVDPGVGSERRILAAEHEGRLFLAPDNGLLTMAGPGDFVSVENESFFLPNGSRTFHGRDRFAPVAAALANGTPLAELGPDAGAVVELDYQPPDYSARNVRGTIVAIDRFGNCITDIERARVPFGAVRLRTSEHSISHERVTYAGGSGREPFLIVGSCGTIEISVANSSAATLLQLRRGDRVEVVNK
jgi:S-adenosylmethionine hydrolase